MRESLKAKYMAEFTGAFAFVFAGTGAIAVTVAAYWSIHTAVLPGGAPRSASSNQKKEIVS